MPLTKLIEPGQRVLVAVSGGPDSTALLIALTEEGHEVVAAHYDHALQPASGEAAAHVARLCAGLGVELITGRRETPMPKGSVQAAARALRYDFLERARASAGADVVALAHTADDVVEGALLHLLRGCGLAGMRGMPARRGVFVRPFLNVWRADVARFLERKGIVALEDPANSNLAFERVRVRRVLLPALERDRPGLARRLHAAAIRAAALQESVAGLAAQTGGSRFVDRAQVASAPEPVAAELMRQLYARAGGVQPSLSKTHLRSMLRLAQPGRGGRGVDLPGGLRLRIVGQSMEIFAAQAPAEVTPRLETRGCEGCDDPQAAHVTPGLTLSLGYRRPGLRMRPAGGRGSRKLQDILVDARVPREDRDRWPLVFAGDRLAIVPGIAVDDSVASAPGTPSLHVTVSGIPFEGKAKKPVLESLNSPPGEPI